jgi:hypothetical protein
VATLHASQHRSYISYDTASGSGRGRNVRLAIEGNEMRGYDIPLAPSIWLLDEVSDRISEGN